MLSKRLWKRLIRNWWRPRKAVWPYPEGWATYNPWKRTFLDMGLSSEEYAQEICDKLNGVSNG
jgi:hypothetical protein